MKKFYTLIFLTFAINICAQSPSFTWVKQFGGTNNESGRATAIDTGGNVICAGVFAGTCDFDPGAGISSLISTGGQDVYVTKLDSMGNLKWARKIGGVITDNVADIKVDVAGNAYLAGTFNATATFGSISLTSSGMGDVYVCKIDTAGNFVWAKRIGGTGNDAGIGLCIDGSGNVFSTGYFNSVADFNPDTTSTFNLTSSGSADIFISKLDAAGNFSAAYKLGGSGFDQGFGIDVDGSGNIITTGNFSGIGDFDPAGTSVTLNAATGQDIFISKLNSTGTYVWAVNMTGTSSLNSGFDLETDATGNIYSTGYFTGTIDFNPGAATANLISTGSTDAYVSKLDSSGNFVWVKQLATDGSYTLALDGNNNVYTGGDFQGTVDFDPGAGSVPIAAGTSLDAYVSKLDASGNYVWAITFATENGDPNMTLDGDDLYITGGFNATVDFDASGATENLISVGSTDAFVVKYSDCSAPSQPGTISGLSSICAGTNNTYSVTAVAGATTYSWTLPGGWTGTSTTNSINTTASGTSGTISVTATNACGTSAPQTLLVTVNPAAPSIPSSIVGSINPCIGVANNFSVTNDPTVTTYNWTLPAGWTGTSTTNSINGIPGSSGIISVTATNGCGTSSSQPLNVTVSDPVLNLVATNASCSDTCDGSINAVAGGGIFPYTYMPFPLSGLCTGNYTVTATDAAGCIATATTTISSPLPVVIATTAGDTVLCDGDGTLINISGADTYTFGGLSVTPPFFFTPTVSAGINVIGMDTISGCIATDVINFVVNELPTVTFTYPNDTVCILVGTFSLSGGLPAGGTYSGPGVSHPNFSTGIAGLGTHTITYTYTDGNGCTNTDDIALTVVACAGIEDNESGSLVIFPNPFTNSISINGIEKNVTVKLYSVLGDLISINILTETNHTIQTEYLRAGIYLITIETENGMVTERVIKQ